MKYIQRAPSKSEQWPPYYYLWHDLAPRLFGWPRRPWTHVIQDHFAHETWSWGVLLAAFMALGRAWPRWVWFLVGFFAGHLWW